MQEPTIYRAPVVALDPEAAATGDEQTGYSQGGYSQNYSAFQSTTVADDTTAEKDYHDFFIPEGKCASHIVPSPVQVEPQKQTPRMDREKTRRLLDGLVDCESSHRHQQKLHSVHHHREDG